MKTLLIVIITALGFTLIGGELSSASWERYQKYDTAFIRQQKANAITTYELCRNAFNDDIIVCTKSAIETFSPQQ